MAIPTLAERISESFTAWECRGRGWDLAPYPVSLEPPYRPFFLLPSPECAQQIDDGKRPSFLSALYEHAQAAFTGDTAKPITESSAFEEQGPFPALEHGGLVTRRILVPADFDARPDVMTQLLSALIAGFHPVSFEIIGHQGKVLIQITCSDVDAEHVFARITDYLPDASVIEEEDALRKAWNKTGNTRVVDFGCADEFFLPFVSGRTFPVDPYIPLISAMARTKGDESLSFQVLFQRTMNPWRGAILNAVAPDGSALFSDAPEFVPRAREKTASSLIACAIRIAARADTHERVIDLLRGTNAFTAQFARPGGNTLIPLTNDGYPDHLHEQAFLERESYRTGMILSLDELLGLVHLPDASVRHEALVCADKRTKALPSVAHGHACVIGENVHRGVRAEATLGITERLQHTMITGASGTGKSTLLVNMIRQDIEQGHGIAVLDAHGDLIDEILGCIPKDRLNDVVVFDPADEGWPVGFNILAATSELEKNLLASDLVGIFQRFSTSWGDTMSTVLSNAVLAILESPNGGTLLHLRRFLIDDAYRNAFLKTVPDQEVRFFWQKEWPLIGSRSIGPILTRLNTFLRPKLLRHIVGQQHPKLRFSSVMNERKIFLAKLSQGLIGNENAYLLGSLVLSKFLQLALSRQSLAKEERQPFFMYLDEAEHFVTPSVAALLTEARKYSVGLTLSFQMLSQLRNVPQVESALLGNAHTRVAFRSGDDDALKLAAGFSSFDADDLRNLSQGEAIVRIGEARNDFNIRTFALKPHEDKASTAQRQDVIERSRCQFAVPLSELTAELDEQRQSFESAPTDKKDGEKEQASPRQKSAVLFNKPDTAAVHESLPREQTITRPTIRPDVPPLGRGGQEHKYLQQLIKRLGEERGFRAVIEEQVKDGQVDVALRRDDLSIACEVSVTTSADHELENAKKCLSAGFGQIWFVVPDKKRREKLEKAVAVEHSDSVIRCMASEDLVTAFDTFVPQETTTQKVVGGYKVKVTRRVVSYDELQKRQSAVAGVIARSLLKRRKDL